MSSHEYRNMSDSEHYPTPIPYSSDFIEIHFP